jgi:hypothetical protein
MQPEIDIITKKVDYLLTVGAKSKVNEWLSTDKSLTQITAERYVLDYLRENNCNFKDSFTGGGVDGYLYLDKTCIGIEATTINKGIPEWILIERLLTYLLLNNYKSESGIEVSYDLSLLEGIKYNDLDIIEKIGSRIIQNNFHSVDGITIKKISKIGSYISWNNTDSDQLFFKNIRNNMLSIFIDKRKQLSTNKQNIVFICVNQLPISTFNPGIFKEIGCKGSHNEWIEELKTIVRETSPRNVLGVCFFVYNLPSEEMMYPLHIIWRDENNKIPINL